MDGVWWKEWSQARLGPGLVYQCWQPIAAQYEGESANHMRVNQASRPGFPGQWPDRVKAPHSRVNIPSYFGHLKIENTHTDPRKEEHLQFIFFILSGARTFTNTVKLFRSCKNKKVFSFRFSYQSLNQYNLNFASEWDVCLGVVILCYPDPSLTIQTVHTIASIFLVLGFWLFLPPGSIRPNLVGSLSLAGFIKEAGRED